MRVLFSIVLLAASCQAIAKMPVEVAATTDDSVGRRLVYALKEKIRDSSSLEFSLDDSATRMQARIVTLERDPNNIGSATVYSLVVTWVNPEQPFPFLITQYTGYCGTSRVESCADDLVAEISEQSDQLLKLFIQAAKG